jgi:hypothetical protein
MLTSVVQVIFQEDSSMLHKPFRGALMVAGLALPIVLASIQHASANGRGFFLRNATSSTIVDVRVSPSSRTVWGSNVLTGPLPRGTNAAVVFNRPNKICLYDLKVTTIDRRILDRRQVNFCKVSTYTITN